jgi:hypothetical protein
MEGIAGASRLPHGKSSTAHTNRSGSMTSSS